MTNLHPTTAEERHPEPCMRCGGNNLTWFVDSAIWNRVMRQGVIEEVAIVCPQCFAILAEQSGLGPTAWELVPEVYADAFKETAAHQSEASAASEGDAAEPEGGTVTQAPPSERTEDSRSVVVTDPPQPPCDECLRLLADIERLEAVAEAAKRFVEAHGAKKNLAHLNALRLALRQALAESGKL